MDYPFVIVSAERIEYSRDQNTARLIYACKLADMAGVAYAMVEGAYNGVAEHSLALRGQGALTLARTLGGMFAQESILIVHAPDRATLATPQGAILAEFTQRIEGTAENYTRIDGVDFSFAA